MASEDVARVHREAIIVEGHRDMFEMNYLAAKGQQYPVLNVTLPRLKRANISTTFYAISGDSLTHANGTYRFLHAALQNIDALRTEMAASQGQMKLILHREDLPAAPTPDTVRKRGPDPALRVRPVARDQSGSWSSIILMADLRSGTMAWTSLIGPSTSGRRSIRLPSSRTSALVRCLPTSPRSRRSWTCRGRPRHRGDVASAITCSRSDSAEQGPSTPKPGKAATLHPKTVTFVTGAKSDFSKWRRHSRSVLRYASAYSSFLQTQREYSC
jgi:hypothetical protein